jgi:predicted N-acetyltransferase YhbS
MMKIQAAKTQKELDEAYDLEARVFGPNYFDSVHRRSINESLDPPAPGDVVVVRDGKSVIGMLRLMPRSLHVLGSTLSAGGLTNVCIHPDHHGRGLGRDLMEAALRILRERGFQVSVTIARRAVDGFYSRFGFLGIDAFPELRVQVPERLPEASRRVHATRGVDSAFDYASAYGSTYGALAFAFDRKPAWWESLKKRLMLKHPGWSVLNLFLDGAPAGYAVLNPEEVVIEAASLPGAVPACAGAALSEAFGPQKERVLRLTPDHPWAVSLRRYNHTLKTRAAWDGGHLLRVLDPGAFCAALSRGAGPGVERALSELGRLKAEDHPVAREMLAHCLGLCLHDCEGAPCRLPGLRHESTLRPSWSPIDEF